MNQEPVSGPAPLEVLTSYPAHDGTLRGFLASRATTRASRAFLDFEGRSWTWGEFTATADCLARGLAAHGVHRGNRVGVISSNSDAYVLLFFALARLGAIMVPVNPDFSADEAGYVLRHAEVCAIATTAQKLAMARAAADDLPIAPWLVLLDGGTQGVLALEELLKATRETALPEHIGADEVCLILYTSGTTGFPKGAMHSQRNFVLAGEGFVERMHLHPEDRLLCVLPLFHINALFYSLGGAVAAGAALVLAPRFSASGFWALAAESRATEVNIIAAIGNILAHRPRAEFVAAHRLAKAYGAPVSQAIVDVFQKEFGVPTIIEGYGMTEVPGVCNLPFEGPHRIGSMGKAALHPDRSFRFAELRVIDDAGNDVATGVVGELLVRTPVVMKGYYKDAEQTAAAFRDGWFATGDLVRRDAEGYYYFISRKKDIIRRRGENVSGAELDRVIGLHPAVAEAAAVAVPSDLGEDEILVAVVLRPGATATAREIADWCAARLAALKVPRYVIFVESLPHTPTHRVAKFKLPKQALQAQATDLGRLQERR